MRQLRGNFFRPPRHRSITGTPEKLECARKRYRTVFVSRNGRKASRLHERRLVLFTNRLTRSVVKGVHCGIERPDQKRSPTSDSGASKNYLKNLWVAERVFKDTYVAPDRNARVIALEKVVTEQNSGCTTGGIGGSILPFREGVEMANQ